MIVGGKTGPRASRRRAGLTLVELTLTMSVVATVLMAAALAFSSSLSAAGQAERTGDAAVFLDTVMQELSVLSYDDLAAENGTQLFDGPTLAQSQYTVDLSVFPSQPDLLQVVGVMTDRRNGRVVGRVSTYRSRR